MKAALRPLAVLAIVGGLSAVGMATASAGISTLGTPGDPNCVGQTTAYVAQGNPTGFLTARGIGNVAAVNGATVKDVKSLIAQYCAGPV